VIRINLAGAPLEDSAALIMMLVSMTNLRLVTQQVF
jgi:hypothetical protein